jgi:S-adenosylmethionine-diacylglycerol 3-amino-3-carboxypropyl transferase
MADSVIADKASFERIRYAQLWEDADALLLGLDPAPGATLVSICSAGDNALSLLARDPARVVVVDLSPAQIACLRLRMSMYRRLAHAEFLELMGSRPSDRRAEWLARALQGVSEEDRAFWAPLHPAIVAHGLGGVGKFERYFRLMRTWLLPLTHSRRTIDDVFLARARPAREKFVRERWSNWRWRLLLGAFFSNAVMGRLGRDPAFFAHVQGSLAQHVARKIDFAAIEQDPSVNPYLRWILKGTHGDALPFAWRAENYETIAARLDRLDIRPGALERFVATGERADGFNLSDIFEYMDEATFAQVYGSLLGASRPNARLVYWNMMVPRRVPAEYAARVERLAEVEARGKAIDKAFFYADFVVERVREAAP